MQLEQGAIIPFLAPQGSSGIGANAGVALGKQQQKAIKTRVLDHVGPYLRLMQSRLSCPSFRPAVSHLQPVLASSLELLPAAAYPLTPASSIGTKFVTSSFFRHRAAINHLVYTPDGRRLLCAGNNGNVSLWNGTNFENELGPGIQAHEASPIRCLAFSHSGLYLLSCDDLGRVKFSKPTLEVLQVYHAHKEPCRSVTFSPTDFKFATGSDDSTVRIFDTFRGQERSLTGHGGDVRWVDWHPGKGVIASCSKDACVKLWDPRAAAAAGCLATLHGHKNGIFQAKWNRNGHWLLTCSRDQLVKLYDVRMLRDVATFSGHGRDVTCCAWHPQHEEVFVSGGLDGSLLFWLASRPDAQGALPSAHEATVWSAAWHPLGHVLASAGADQKCQFWCRKRPGDIFQDSYEQDPGAHAAAAFAGTAAAPSGGIGGGGGADGAAAAAAAAALSSGLLGPVAPGLTVGAAAAAAAGGAPPGVLGGASGAAAAAGASRPHVIPGIGAVLDQLATANLQTLMAVAGPSSTGASSSAGAGPPAATAPGGGGRTGGSRAPGTAPAPASAPGTAGSKRGRDDYAGRPPRFGDRDREREYDRVRDRDGAMKALRLEGPPPPGSGDGPGGGAGGPPGGAPGGGMVGGGNSSQHDPRRGPGGGAPPHQRLHHTPPPYDGGPGPGPGYGRPPPHEGPRHQPPPRYPPPHDGAPYGEPYGDPRLHGGRGGRGGGGPPTQGDARGPGGPGPGPARGYGGPPPPHDGGGYGGGRGGPPPGFRQMPPPHARDAGPYELGPGPGPGRGPPHRGGPPPQSGPGRGFGRGRGPPPPGWPGRR